MEHQVVKIHKVVAFHQQRTPYKKQRSIHGVQGHSAQFDEMLNKCFGVFLVQGIMRSKIFKSTDLLLVMHSWSTYWFMR